MTIYRMTIYDNQGDKAVDEIEDNDELRDQVEAALTDIEKREIKSFAVSRVSRKNYEKPFWEK
jgi:hypothetical protein